MKNIVLVIVFVSLLTFMGCNNLNNREKKTLSASEAKEIIKEYLDKKYESNFEVYDIKEGVTTDIFSSSNFLNAKVKPIGEEDSIFDVSIRKADKNVTDNYATLYLKNKVEEAYRDIAQKYWNNISIKINISGGLTEKKWSIDDDVIKYINEEKCNIYVDIYITRNEFNKDTEIEYVYKFIQEIYEKGIIASFDFFYENGDKEYYRVYCTKSGVTYEEIKNIFSEER